MENNLKELRQKQNLTQEELAQILNITRQTIIAIERNKYDPTLRLALKIAQFFETDIEKIFKLSFADNVMVNTMLAGLDPKN